MSNSGLPDEQLATLKVLIHEHLRSAGVYESMRAIVSQVVADPAGSGDDQADAAGTDAIIRALQQKGVISDLVASLSAQLEPPGAGRESLAAASSPTLTLPVLLTGERYLHISLLGGKAFVDQISTGRGGAGAVETLSIHAQLGSQRARSRPVAATIDPPFDDSFLFKLAPPAPGGVGGAAGLLSQKSLLHLVLLRSTADGAVREVVGTHLLEWRKVLTVGAAAACTVSVELSGVREEAKLPVGVLDLRLELLPRPSDEEAKELPAERDLLAQLRAERASEADAERAFFAYARAWWHEYVTQRPLHRDRLVKIFALSEFGVQRPVTTFVRPIVADRLLESAAHAARFVALLPFERHATVGDGSAESWSTLHSLLVRRKGDVDEHALLLCSLLLGFGLDAYVAVGTDTQGGHLWVITRPSPTRTVFWESLSGQRTVHDLNGGADGARAAHYRTVGCVFNHERFYANVQPDDSVAGCNFELERPQLWKAMEPSLIRALTPMPSPTLAEGSLPPARGAEEALELALRELIAQHREPLGLGTFWDERLSAYLAPALAAYETERVSGAAYGNDEFQQAIKRHVPEGFTFKGFPQLFSHTVPARVLFGLLKSNVALDILQARGEHVRHAVRCKVVNYPDDVRAVWVMVATKFKPK